MNQRIGRERKKEREREREREKREKKREKKPIQDSQLVTYLIQRLYHAVWRCYIYIHLLYILYIYYIYIITLADKKIDAPLPSDPNP